MTTAKNTVALLTELYGDRREACRTPVGDCLDALLADALIDLDRCAGERNFPLHLRSGLCQVIDRVTQLRAHLPGMGGGMDGYADARMQLAEVEQVSLFNAFRSRCEDLACRLADPEMAVAAVEELQLAVNVLDRSVG